MVEKMELKPLPPTEAKAYRAAAARLNYLSLDRWDLAFATKELSRTMSSPSAADAFKLKRVVRYLKGQPRATRNQPGCPRSYIP